MAPITKLLHGNLTLLLQINCLFEAGTVLCVFHLLRKLYPAKPSFIVSLVYLLIPFVYTMSSVFTNQLASTFFLYLGICVIFSDSRFKWGTCCIGGIILSISYLLRPEAVLFLAVGMILFVIQIVTRSIDADGLAARLIRAAPIALCCAVFIIMNIAFSQIFIWTNLNPNGLKNNYPLYKFSMGLNEASIGQYSQDEADYLMSLYFENDAETRDDLTIERIKDHLSVGPIRLMSLVLKKADVIWTDRYEAFPSFVPFADRDIVSIFGYGIRISILKNLFALVDSLFFLTMFTLCAATQFQLFRYKNYPLLPMTFTVLFILAFFTFCLIEVQRRYCYFMMPALFYLMSAERFVLKHKL